MTDTEKSVLCSDTGATCAQVVLGQPKNLQLRGEEML